MSNRNLTFDIAKAISVVIIVIYHLYEAILSGLPLIFFSWIVHASMALFFYSSAKFLSGSKIQNIKDAYLFIKKRLRRFYVLYVLAAISLLLVGFNAEIRVFITTILGISSYFPPQPSTLWFMSMLMSFYFITPLILYFEKKTARAGILFLIFICLFVIAKFVTPIDDRFFLYFPFYGAGFLVQDFDFSKLRLKWKWLENISICVLFISTVLLHTHFLKENFIANSLLQYWGCFLGILLILGISSWIAEKQGWIITLLTKIGYSTLAIYLYHRLFFYFLLSDFYLSKDDLLSVLYSIFIVLPLTIVGACYIQKVHDLILRKIIKS